MGNIINGLHFILDGRTKDPNCFTKDNIEAMLKQLVTDLKMTMIYGPITLEVPVEPMKLNGDVFLDDGGTSSFCVISTSHIATHLWPQRKAIMIDIASCKDFDANIAKKTIIKFMQLDKFKIKKYYRKQIL